MEPPLGWKDRGADRHLPVLLPDTQMPGLLTGGMFSPSGASPMDDQSKCSSALF
jgi:hypothetical protein